MKNQDKSKWIIVSNRLPLVMDEKGQLKKGSGGLITAITGIKSATEMLWIGAVPSSDLQLQHNYTRKIKNFKDRISFSPIFLDENKYDQYYNGFCNDVLWPLFHYEPGYMKFKEENWATYLLVNQQFADDISKIAREGDIVWIQDFHLFFVGEYLKKIRPELKVGFFQHIPFPSSEIFRQFPKAKEILRAMMGVDLIGFHEYSYVRHFCNSVKEIVGIESSLLTIEHENHLTRLGVFPASIDSEQFIRQSMNQKTETILNKWKKNIGKNLKIILGVDRLDYSKGIDLKLIAFREFLEAYPAYRGKVQLLQLAIPSRTEVPEYQELKNNIECLISDINGRYGKADYVPVKYIFNTVPPHELSALYRLSDMLLVTSKRDGMNLVALEYVVSQEDSDPGVVLLSQFTGAISTLVHALPINPWDQADTAEKIFHGLSKPLHQRKLMNLQMKEYLRQYTATVWAKRFIKELTISQHFEHTATINLSHLTGNENLHLTKRIKETHQIVFFIDFDGTLSPIVKNPQDAFMLKETYQLIKKLQQNKKVKNIIIISGRDRHFLQKQFKKLNLDLACEHGSKFYNSKTHRWLSLISGGKGKWYTTALKIISDFTTRVPGSFVEKKEKAIVWHFRNSPPSFAEYQAQKLKVELEGLMSDFPITVTLGKKVVEIKDVMANKGQFIQWVSQYYEIEKTLYIALGDDTTDEDMFKELQAFNSITIKVGKETTRASHRLLKQEDVHHFLDKISTLLS